MIPCGSASYCFLYRLLPVFGPPSMGHLVANVLTHAAVGPGIFQSSSQGAFACACSRRDRRGAEKLPIRLFSLLRVEKDFKGGMPIIPNHAHDLNLQRWLTIASTPMPSPLRRIG